MSAVAIESVNKKYGNVTVLQNIDLQQSGVYCPRRPFRLRKIHTITNDRRAGGG
jgi:hypothetical protein